MSDEPNILHPTCEWTHCSCTEPVMYDLTYLHNGALVEGSYCFDHAHAMAREYTIYVADKRKQDDE